jgi:hypothetical protein
MLPPVAFASGSLAVVVDIGIGIVAMLKGADSITRGSGRSATLGLR